MNIVLKKALNDLRSVPGRTALVILALVIGLWGVGSILVSYIILKNDLNENYVRTDPAHVIITSKDFNKLDLEAFRNMPEIESAEFRDLSLQRIEVYPDQWIPLWVFGVEDFDKFNLARFYNEKGAKIPSLGSILIERDGEKISNLKVGSSARVRANGKIFEMPITGFSFDPAQAPATQDHFIYSYVDKKTYTAITGEAANQRLLFRFKNVKTKQDVQTATDSILEYLKSQGIAVTSVNILKPNEHPHQWQLNTLLFLEGSIGLLAFLLGAVLVSQLMGAILSQQIRQIGILKAIGATGLQVLTIYILMVLVFGVISGIIAIPLAIASGYGFAEFVAYQINFKIPTTTLPASLYLYFISISLILPILLSLPALLKGTKVSVHEAISDYGIKSNGGKADIIPTLPVPNNILMALRNTMRRKERMLVTIITMALGVAIFSTGFNVRESLVVLLSDMKKNMRYDVQVVLKEQIPKKQALSPFKDIKNVSRIESWNGGFGVLQSKIISTADGVGIIALPHDTDLLKPRVIEGNWLKGSVEPEIVMNQQAMEVFHNPAIGKYHPLTIGGKTVNIKLIGVIEEFGVAKIYIDKGQYDTLANPGHLVNTLMFVAENKNFDNIMALKKDIEKAIEPTNMKILYVMSQAERVQVIYDHLNIILTMITFLALLVLIVGALGMASAMGINIMERTREIGVLRAIGATPKMIYGLFITEGMIISVSSIALGLLLAWPLSIVASSFFGNLMLGNGVSLRFAFSSSGFWITIVTTFVFGWLASRIPARNAIRVSTREALSYE
jgi:putative ABC transport system permease protein